jgi:hypothetical protein
MITFNWEYSDGTPISNDYKYFFINKVGKGFVSANKPILDSLINDNNWTITHYSIFKTNFVGNFSNVDWEFSMRERPLALMNNKSENTKTVKTYTVVELEDFASCNFLYKYLISDLNSHEIKKEEGIQDMVKTLINKGYKVTKD